MRCFCGNNPKHLFSAHLGFGDIYPHFFSLLSSFPPLFFIFTWLATPPPPPLFHNHHHHQKEKPHRCIHSTHLSRLSSTSCLLPSIKTPKPPFPPSPPPPIPPSPTLFLPTPCLSLALPSSLLYPISLSLSSSSSPASTIIILLQNPHLTHSFSHPHLPTIESPFHPIPNPIIPSLTPPSRSR